LIASLVVAVAVRLLAGIAGSASGVSFRDELERLSYNLKSLFRASDGDCLAARPQLLMPNVTTPFV
jgi:hypothetical protein